jgi:hypothetical protein
LLLRLLVIFLCMGSAAAAQRGDPPVPPGRDPGGVAVALISTGIDYTDPEIARALARDGEGQLIGWDFVENDDRPFGREQNVALASAGAGGTALARMLATRGGAGKVRLIPIRAAKQDPQSLAQAIAYCAHTPAHVVVVPMWDEDRASWEPFRETAERFKDLLVVIPAGDGARDIDREPVFPAALGLDHFLVVAALDERANWGPETVDAAVAGAPAKLSFRADGPQSTSQLAGPLAEIEAAAIAAILAAEVLRGDPQSRGIALKEQVLRHAAQHVVARRPRTRSGIILGLDIEAPILRPLPYDPRRAIPEIMQSPGGPGGK